ncbi:hypothetical protein BJ508DRAFT_310814 [Ascobolus immersus RN42]|uniref:Uncharacterized protein n=1 Tax=Ascobolus immersus RN42 TaxID=1160509 RepID=A0A3N4HSA4_ASCIM|nr:hypothetical protein BJ508DRAFT_310814 [Ascobolus immersus RN42]
MNRGTQAGWKASNYITLHMGAPKACLRKAEKSLRRKSASQATMRRAEQSPSPHPKEFQFGIGQPAPLVPNVHDVHKMNYLLQRPRRRTWTNRDDRDLVSPVRFEETSRLHHGGGGFLSRSSAEVQRGILQTRRDRLGRWRSSSLIAEESFICEDHSGEVGDGDVNFGGSDATAPKLPRSQDSQAWVGVRVGQHRDICSPSHLASSCYSKLRGTSLLSVFLILLVPFLARPGGLTPNG